MWHFDMVPEIELAAACGAVSDQVFETMMTACDKIIQMEAAEIAASLIGSGAPAPEIAVVIITALTLVGGAVATAFTGPIPVILSCLMGVTATPIWCWREIWRS